MMKNNSNFRVVGRGLAVVLAGGFLVGAGAQSLRGQGMPPALRENIHTLFDRHDTVRRTVTETDDGYVSVTESDDPRVAGALREHVAQMEARLKEGFGVRRWDPAFPEYAAHYRDMEVKMEPTDKGLRVTVKGRTPEAVRVARNHATVVSDFAAHGWEAHDRSHPAVLGRAEDAEGKRGGPGGHRHGKTGAAKGPVEPHAAHGTPAIGEKSPEAGCADGKGGACCKNGQCAAKDR